MRKRNKKSNKKVNKGLINRKNTVQQKLVDNAKGLIELIHEYIPGNGSVFLTNMETGEYYSAYIALDPEDGMFAWDTEGGSVEGIIEALSRIQNKYWCINLFSEIPNKYICITQESGVKVLETVDEVRQFVWDNEGNICQTPPSEVFQLVNQSGDGEVLGVNPTFVFPDADFESFED